MESLKECLPGRTSHEIASLIGKYKQRAKKSQVNQISSPSVDTASSSSASSSSAGVTRSRDSPLSQWSNYLGHLMSAHHKRDDVSEALISTLEKYSLDESAKCSDETSNYSSIYQFLADCLCGKCPRELNAQNSLIVLALLKQTKHLLNYVGCDSERKLIQNMRSGNSTMSGETNQHNEDETVAVEIANSQTSSCRNQVEENEQSQVNNLFEESRLSDCLSGEASDPLAEKVIEKRLNQFVEKCMDLPKVRKIKACLNPLAIPVSMVLEEANGLLDAIEDERWNCWSC